MFSLGDIRKSKWYLSESRFHENCSPLDVNKHEKYVLFSTAMKLLFFFQMFENHLLTRILFLVDMTEMIVTAFDNYYSNVFQDFFCDGKLGNSAVFGSPKRIDQFLMTWQISHSYQRAGVSITWKALKITRNDLS